MIDLAALDVLESTQKPNLFGFIVPSNRHLTLLEMDNHCPFWQSYLSL